MYKWIKIYTNGILHLYNIGVNMLNKNEVIKELTNEEFIVRNAIYEYVCKLHLYDDK